MTIEDALELLELFESKTYSEEIIKKAARKAKAKWHPDRVAAAGSIKVKEYEAKFKLISTAEEWLLENVFGRNETEPSVEDKYEQMKEYATKWHEEMKEKWPTIETSRENYTEEVETVFEGWTVSDFILGMHGNRFFDCANAIALMIISIVLYLFFDTFTDPVDFTDLRSMQDLNGYLGAWVHGFNYNFFSSVMIGAGFLINIFELLFIEALLFWLISLVFGIGIVRHLLPNVIYKPYLYIADKLNYILRSKRSLIKPFMVLYAETVENFAELMSRKLTTGISQLLWLVSLLYKGNKRIGEVKVVHRWYANISEAHVKRIMKKSHEELDYSDLVHLKHLRDEYGF